MRFFHTIKIHWREFKPCCLHICSTSSVGLYDIHSLAVVADNSSTKKTHLEDRRQLTKRKVEETESANDWMTENETHSREKKMCFPPKCWYPFLLPSTWTLRSKSFTHTVCFHLPVPTQTLSHTLFPLSQMDHDPRNPTYIASQGPLPSTVTDFWQVKLIFIHCLSFIFYHFISTALTVCTTTELHCVWHILFRFTNGCVLNAFFLGSRKKQLLLGVSPVVEFLKVESVK